MCELFGFSSSEKTELSGYLRSFFAHSVNHPDGWGIAVFYGDAVSLEKEPLPAWQSHYLQSRLKQPFEAADMIAHIRKASVGNITYENSHPFVKRDISGRAWTLEHNGTIFKSEILDSYIPEQKGSTDSERILLHILHKINSLIEGSQAPLSARERFQVIEEVVNEISEGNKVNMLVYDGEHLYAHVNHKGSLHYRELENATVISTQALEESGWEPMPLMRVIAFKGGRRVFEGKEHGFEYFKKEDRDDSLNSSAL